MANEPWTAQELRLLEEKYLTMTAERIQRDFLPHRTLNAIRIVLTRCGLSRKTPKADHVRTFKNTGMPWTDEESKILAARFHDTTVTRLQREYLPDRSVKAIERRAARMGLVRENGRPGNKKPYAKRPPCTRWSVEELAILAEYGPDMPAKELQEKYLPDKTVVQIRTKLRNESITDPVDKAWTDDEVRILRENAGRMDVRSMAALLPDRTVVAIRNKAVKLGITTGAAKPSRK